MFDLLLKSHSEVKRYASQFGMTTIGDWQFIVGGWSPKHERPVAFIFSEQDGRLLRFDVQTHWISPEDGLPDVNPDSEEKMIDLAKLQYARYLAADQGCGGSLILAEIERDRIALRKLCDLSSTQS